GHNWAWESSVGYSQDKLRVPGSPSFLPEVVDELLSRTDPTTALNVFGDGRVNSSVVLEELVRGSSRDTTDGEGELMNWQGQFDGLLAHLAGRELRAAMGAEYREERMEHLNQTVFPQAPPQAWFTV